MIGLDVDNEFLVGEQKALEAALSTNPKTEQMLRKLIREVILDVRAKAIIKASDALKHDPRNAIQSIRTSVYKRVLGANINIFNSRKAHGSTSYEPPRKGVSGRGGNRCSRSAETKRYMGYEAHDRGFILRWQNDGAGQGGRKISFTVDERRETWPSVRKWNKNPNTGNREAIPAKNFFRNATEPLMVEAVDNLANLIDDELEAILNNK